MDGSGDLVLRVTVCFSEDQGSVPNTHIGWLTAACNSSFRGSDAFWRLCGINTHGYHLGFLFLFFFFNEGMCSEHVLPFQKISGFFLSTHMVAYKHL